MYVYLYIYYDSAKIKSISKSPYVVMDNIDATTMTVVNFGNVPIFLAGVYACWRHHNTLPLHVGFDHRKSGS